MVNKYVLASHLGHTFARVYTGEKELVARILVDKGLATMADSYSEAINASVPDVPTLDSSQTPTLKTAFLHKNVWDVSGETPLKRVSPETCPGFSCKNACLLPKISVSPETSPKRHCRMVLTSHVKMHFSRHVF